ncbi:lumenal Hsp70 protein [Malassezia caprae]|uniref:Lumenal Hsp70 protein n=1 Tax=Malassezia caprae TaxID=1381934 RepID=A0AAF0EEJ1_9BASI|nr:lumenal Hsp70 protein [Malassezia caprae]
MRASITIGVLLAYVALGLVLLAAPSEAIGVVSIDYGTEWIKAALIKPGKPYDLVLSRDSKRKVQASVAFKGEVRKDGNLEKQEQIIGADAYAYASRNPLQSYHAAKLLLGQSCLRGEPEDVKQYRDVFGNLVAKLPGENSTGSSCIVVPSRDAKAFWRPEELVGMQLDHVRELAEETAGEMLSIGYGGSSWFSAQHGLDTVITVPIFYTPRERQALLDAALLAGFRPRFISDAAAAAANYAHSRTFATPERHIFYDAGSGAVRATLVEFSKRANSARADDVQVQVLDAAWDRHAGGLAMDMLLREMLADAFDQENPSRPSVRGDARAMARLLREANKVKHVLSANAAATASVEGLADDLDLRTTIDREAFETKMREAHLLPRFSAPLQELLQRTKMSWNDIQSVVLVGGSTRVPAVQAELRALGVPDNKLAQNVNADEAAVMGAALAVASTQPQLRMKQVEVHDGHMYPVELEVASHKETVFGAGPLSTEAYELTLHGLTDDFDVRLRLKSDRLEQGDDGELQTVHVSGLTEGLADLRAKNEMGHVDLNVNLTVRNAPFGTYGVSSAFLTVTPHKTITGSLKSLLGMNKDKASSNATEASNATETGSLAPQATQLTFSTTHHSMVRPLSGQEKITSLERLRMIVYEAKQRALRDASFNELEATVYRARDLLEDSSFSQAASASETSKLRSTADALGAWLSDESDGADAEAIQKKLRELTKLIDPVQKRLTQAARREASAQGVKDALEQTAAFLQAARANLTAAMEQKGSSKYTVVELDAMEAQLKKDRTWLEDGLRAQEKRQVHEDPAILVEDMDKRSKKMRDMLTRMNKRKIPKTRPKKTKSASSSTTPTASATSTHEVPVHDDL